LKPGGKLTPNQRYHWRVRAADKDGNSTGWSRPMSFWFQGRRRRDAPRHTAHSKMRPIQKLAIPRAGEAAELEARSTDADNLRSHGHDRSRIRTYWEGADEAVDGFEASVWLPDETDANRGEKAESSPRGGRFAVSRRRKP
jgi:hypothetical protein